MLRITVLAGCTLVALAAAPVPSAAPGITFSIRSTNSANANPSNASTMRVQSLNGVLRFENDASSSGPGKEPGGYTLVNPNARSLTMVMPQSHQYIQIKFDSTAGLLIQAMSATAAVSDIKVSGSSLGSGGTVNGYSTNHYRITMSYTQLQGSSSSGGGHVESTEDFWVTDALKDVPDPMEAFTRAFGGKNGMPTMGGSLNDLMRKRGDAERKLFSGLPIKTMTKTVAVNTSGAREEDNSTMEILDLKKVNLEPSAFQIPAGYAQVDFKSMLNVGDQLRSALRGAGGAGNKSGANGAAKSGTANTSIVDDAAAAAKAQAQAEADSAKAAADQAAKDAAKSGVEGAKEKAKCALGGLFRKKC